MDAWHHAIAAHAQNMCHCLSIVYSCNGFTVYLGPATEYQYDGIALYLNHWNHTGIADYFKTSGFGETSTVFLVLSDGHLYCYAGDLYITRQNGLEGKGLLKTVN